MKKRDELDDSSNRRKVVFCSAILHYIPTKGCIAKVCFFRSFEFVLLLLLKLFSACTANWLVFHKKDVTIWRDGLLALTANKAFHMILFIIDNSNMKLFIIYLIKK